MSEFKKGGWVKLVDAYCIDRDAGLVNGAVGRVSGFCETGGPTIDFGGANPDRIMLSQQLALISPAEAASVGDTVTVSNSLWWPGGDRLVVGVDDNDGLRDMRLAVIIDGRRRWVINRFVTALKRGADVKIAEAPKPEVTAPKPEAAAHIDEMNKLLRSCSDLTNQDFFNKSIAEALIYLLEHVREEDMPK
jgi:hypothetical protein